MTLKIISQISCLIISALLAVSAAEPPATKPFDAELFNRVNKEIQDREKAKSKTLATPDDSEAWNQRAIQLAEQAKKDADRKRQDDYNREIEEKKRMDEIAKEKANEELRAERQRKRNETTPEWREKAKLLNEDNSQFTLTDKALNNKEIELNKWHMSHISDIMDGHTVTLWSHSSRVESDDKVNLSMVAIFIRKSLQNGVEVYFTTNPLFGTNNPGIDENFPILVKFDDGSPVSIETSPGSKGTRFLNQDLTTVFLQRFLNSKNVYLRVNVKEWGSSDNRYEVNGLSEFIQSK